MLCNGNSWNKFSLSPSDWAIENSKYLSQESFFTIEKWQAKLKFHFPASDSAADRHKSYRKINQQGEKKIPTLVHSEFGELFGGEQASSGGEQVTLGNWVSLFAGGSGLGLYTWQQISIDIWLVLIWAIYSGIICVFLTCCEDSHCQMPWDGCRMQCIPQSLLRGHKPHIICGEEGRREKWSNN